jgi:hypothetical protein
MASDPGMTRLQTAAAAAVAMTTALGVEYGYAKLTNAGAQGITIAMLLGAVMAMMGSMALNGSSAWLKVRTAVFFPVSMGLGMVLGIAVSPHTDLMLVVFVVVMFIAVFVRRFGIPFFFYGFMVWMGYFFAAFLHATLSMLPSLLAEVVVASVWVLLLSLTLLRTSSKNTLTRTRRAFGARARAVAHVCAGLLEAEATEPGQVNRWQLKVRAAQTRLAESALMIEAWSAEVPVLPAGVSASALRRMILDAQLAVDGLVAASEDLRGGDTRLVLEAARVTELFANGSYAAADQAARSLRDRLDDAAGETLAAHRLAGSITEYLTLANRADEVTSADETDEFEPAVTLAMGNLPGSAAVAKEVTPRGWSWNPLLRLDLTTRQAIQVAVAGALAIVAGRELSETRYYWAVIAAFVAFTGTATRSEVFVKAMHRVVGTLVGLGAGIGFAHLTAGSTPWVLVVIVGSMFLGFYLQRVSYAYMIFFITIMVSQLYTVLNEFSAGLLVLRLEETAIGAAIGIGVALLLTPLSTRDTVSSVERTLLTTLADLVRATGERIEGGGRTPDLDAQTRRLDNGLRELLLVAAPLVGALPWGSGSRRTRHRLTLYAAIARHTRGLAGILRRNTAVDSALAVPSRALAEVAAALAEAPNEANEDVLTQLSLAEMALAQPWSADAEPVWRELVHLRHLLHELATGDTNIHEKDVPRRPVTAKPQSTGPVEIRGSVRDADSASVGYAVLTLIDLRGRQVSRAVARADGGYRLDAPATGTYVLITSAKSHRPSASTVMVRQSADGSGIVVDVLLTDTGGLAGTVTAAGSGYPVEGALTTLTDPHGAVAGTRRTGADGGYAFSALKDGEYTLVVSADLHHPAARTVTVSGSENSREDVQLAGFARLSGVAVTTSGAHPVPHVRVTLLDGTGVVVAVADTDEAGRYTFDGLAEGEYTALASGYPPAVSALRITGRATTFRHDVELKH